MKLLSLGLGLLACAACGNSADGTGGSGGGTGGEGGKGGDPNVKLPELAEGWNEFKPGGDTICSRGTPYSYWVRPGKVNKLIVDYIGGGACWNELTCSVADAIFDPDVESVRSRIESGVATGIYDHDRDDNPFKDWYHVIVPYCTGDIHWGDAVKTYGTGASAVTINHKGAVNSRAVLDWVYTNFSKPEQILVTGCSAGSYGAVLWSADVAEHYNESQVFQFGDSGAGVITDTFFQESFPSWNAEAAFPKQIPELDPSKVDIKEMALPDLYVGIANHYSEQRFSQYNTHQDENQIFFFKAMGGMEADWSPAMYSAADDTEARAKNYAAFIAPGEQHCIIPYDNFYSVEANGVRLTTWLQNMLDGKPIERVRCQGAECDKKTP
jgi:hypothetical protein